MPKSDEPPRKRRSPQQLRALILEAAAQEFESNGFAGTTTVKIARRAHTTEAQIFRMFDSKAELFRAAIFDALNGHFVEFQAKVSAAPQDGTAYRDQAELYITELRDFITRHSRMLMSLIVTKSYMPEPWGGLNELDGLQDYFERGASMMKARTDEPFDVPPELMVRVSFAALMGVVLFRDLLLPPSLASEEDMRRATIGFMIDGVAANARAEAETAKD